MQTGNAVDVLEASVEHGNGHALAAQAYLMQPVAREHLYLRTAHAVRVVLHRVPLLELFAHHPFHLVGHLDRVGRMPHHPGLPDAGQLPQSFEQQTVARAHHHSVVPAARAQHLGVVA